MHELGRPLGIHKRQALPVPREDTARKIVDRYRDESSVNARARVGQSDTGPAETRKYCAGYW